MVKHLVSDGCEKMVGWKIGVHASMEKIFKTTFGRIICYFHHLEKSFETIFLLYSGHTTSPGTYSDGVGKFIKGDIHKMEVVEFQVVPNPSLLALIDGISDKTFKDLSNDHQIFIGLVRIIITGVVNQRWARMKIGPVVTSRFTTSQTRCCRLWLSEPNPSFELTRVVKYLVSVWAECFLTIKHRNSMVMAPKVLLLEVMLTSKHCSNPEKTMLSTSMSFNGQMGHHESVLLSMLASSSPEERELAVNTIFNIREMGPIQWKTPTGLRPFKVGLF